VCACVCVLKVSVDGRMHEWVDVNGWREKEREREERTDTYTGTGTEKELHSTDMDTDVNTKTDTDKEHYTVIVYRNCLLYVTVYV
jgi:hypothetical protein